MLDDPLCVTVYLDFRTIRVPPTVSCWWGLRGALGIGRDSEVAIVTTSGVVLLHGGRTAAGRACDAWEFREGDSYRTIGATP